MAGDHTRNETVHEKNIERLMNAVSRFTLCHIGKHIEENRSNEIIISVMFETRVIQWSKTNHSWHGAIPSGYSFSIKNKV